MKVSTEERAKFERSQKATIAEGLAFADGEEEAAHRFLDLAMETYDALVAAGHSPTYAFEFRQFDTLIHALTRGAAALSPDLIWKWRSWGEEYRAIMARQPRQALLQALCLISSSHDSSSWPCGYEWNILKWVASGELAPLPFEDRRGIATPEFYDEQRSLRQRAQGWFYYDFGAKPGEVFIQEDQLATWCREQEAKEAKRQLRIQEAKQRLNLWAQARSKR